MSTFASVFKAARLMTMNILLEHYFNKWDFLDIARRAVTVRLCDYFPPPSVNALFPGP